MHIFLVSLAATCVISTAAHANDPITYEVTDQSYDDVQFGLENAIIDAGLVISNHNHVGSMLDRTAQEVGDDTQIYIYADVYGFCSAELSRAAMAEDALNIRFCPYNIFMYQQTEDSPVVIGFDDMPEGAMHEVEKLLDTITRNAVGLD